MKQTGERFDRIQSLSDTIQEGLFSLERHHRSSEEEFRTLLENTTRLVEITSHSGNEYAGERALRLQAALRKMNEEFLLLAERYGVLHRQINKIRDTPLADYFSPFIRTEMDRILERRLDEEKKESGKGRRGLLVYSLNNTRFAIHGTLLRQYDVEEARTAGEESLLFFPGEGERSDFFYKREQDPGLLVVRESKSDRLYGLWYDEHLRTLEEPLSFFAGRVEEAGVEHRLIHGRIHLEGMPVYWMGELP